MKNLELAKIFDEIADCLETRDVEFKPRAYRRVARVLESAAEDVGQVYHDGGREALEKISGVGGSIAKKIAEYIETGKLKYYQQQKKLCPVDLSELTAIEGVGPKMVRQFYKKLGVKTLDQLEKAARQHKIQKLAGFKAKTEENILKGIEFLKKSQGRHLLGLTLLLMNEVIGQLKKLKEVDQISPAGSVRRMKETIGDLDILVTTSKPKKVIDYFVKLPQVVRVYGQGPTRASVRFRYKMDGDLRVVPKAAYGSALQYFTGNKDHNIKLRKIAITKGYKLNEYGLYKGRKRIAGKTEAEIYKKLGLKIMEPELRTDSGEIDALIKNKLPQIVGYDDIRGDLQLHSKWSDGLNSIKEMAVEAKKIGHQYMAISDHVGRLRIANSLSNKEIKSYLKEIEKLNKEIKNFTILKGAEVSIEADGSLDVKDEYLKQFDFVIAAVHSRFNLPRTQMTKRIIRAMNNKYVSTIGHPTGRLIFSREEYSLDLNKIYQAASRTKTALEINSSMDRLDLRDKYIRAALQYNVKFTIGSDAHNKEQLNSIYLGVAQARRGWAAKKDILNCLTVKQLLGWLGQKRKK